MDPPSPVEEAIPAPNFELTTSLRWKAEPSTSTESLPSHELPQLDGIPLYYHRDRLIFAAEAFNWSAVISLLSKDTGLALLHSKLLSFSMTLPSQSASYKLRLTVSSGAIITINASEPITSSLFPLSLPVPAPFHFPINKQTPLPMLYISPQPIQSSLFTRHKTTSRAPYQLITSLFPSSITSVPPTMVEILLHDTCNQITECVYSTPYFKRGNDVVTPSSKCGGNMGVTRRLAVEKGWCKSGFIRREDVTEGEVVWLSNAVRGFWAARLTLVVPKGEGREEGGGRAERIGGGV